MKQQNYFQRFFIAVATFVGIGLWALPVVASGQANANATGTGSANSTSTTSHSTTSSSNSALEQQHLSLIKSKGDAEINRRLTQLGKLTTQISDATKLSAANRATLTTQITNEVSGLQALETKLNGETTVAAADTDVQNIVLEYRVYVLITPKVWLVKVSDDELVIAGNLQVLATELSTRIQAAQTAGKNVTTLQTELADMNAKIAAAQSIANSINQAVINLQPTDYNTSHTVLSGDATQLKTVHTDNEAAYTDAKNIVTGLKSLE